MKRAVDDMHCREMLVIYGQTESSPVITMSRANDGMEHRVSTIGCASPNSEVKIVSRETGETLPTREQGAFPSGQWICIFGAARINCINDW